MKPFALGLTGFTLIAVCYGLARFAWGLMLPDVVQDIPFTPQIAGILSACSFAAYCIAILIVPMLEAFSGPRLPALIASLSAATGLCTMALSNSVWLLGSGLFVAGLSAGLSSPALAAGVSRCVRAEQQPQMNTVINAGTSAGIIFSVPVLLWLPGGWRMACLVFSMLAMVCSLCVWRTLPGPINTHKSVSLRQILHSGSLPRLVVIAFISGMASAAWWSFGPDLLHQIHVAPESISLLWMTAGAAGIAGMATGPLAKRVGMKAVYRLSQCCMAAPLLLLAASHQYSGWLLPAVALGGAGYVTLSGVLLVWGASATEASPATGVSALFFMLAAGQFAGSLVFGQLFACLGSSIALSVFSVMPLVMIFVIPHQKRHMSLSPPA